MASPTPTSSTSSTFVSPTLSPTTNTTSIGNNITSTATLASSSSVTNITISSSTSSAQSSATNGAGGIPAAPGSILYSAKQNQSGLPTQLLICGCTGLLCFLLFCFLRTRWPVIFAPRKSMKRRKPPKLPDTFFGWIIPLIRISKTEMLDKVGLDAVIMLDFVIMAFKIFSLCSFFGVVTLIPISVTVGNFSNPLLNPVDHLSITVIDESSPYLVAYLVFTYFFTFVTWFFLQQNYDSYIYMRARYLLQLSSSLVCKSIIVTGLPDELRTDQALADYFERLGVGIVTSAHVVRHVKRLKHILRHRARALDKLEEAYVKYWGNPCRLVNYHPDILIQDAARLHREDEKNRHQLPEQQSQSQSQSQPQQTTVRTAAAEHDDPSSEDSTIENLAVESKSPPERTSNKVGNHTSDSNHKNKNNACTTADPAKSSNVVTIQQLQRPMVRTGLLGLYGETVDAIDYYTKEFEHWDKLAVEARASPLFDMTSVGFVTFERMESALIASQIAINPVPFRCRTATAYEPRDVLWRNIHISGKQRVARNVIVWGITIALVVFWSGLVTLLSSFTSIEAINRVAPGLGKMIEGRPFLQNLVQGLVPTALVNIIMQILPLIFDYLGILQGMRARSAISEATLSKYFFFLIFNVLLVFTIAFTVIDTIVNLFQRPTEIATILATSLPKVSPFFINYTILQGLLLMPLNLLLLGSLILRGFSIYFLAKTPREHANARSPDAFNYGASYPALLLVFVIVTEYSIISPIIMVFGSFYFGITYIVYKYQFLYVYFRPYEAAGQLWTMVFPRLIVGLILFQLTMLGIFVLKESYVLSGLCVPLIVLTVIFKFTIDAAYSRNSYYLPMQILRDEEHQQYMSQLVFNDNNNDNIDTKSSNKSSANNNDTEAAAAAVPAINVTPTDDQPTTAKSRWTSALKSIQDNTRNRFQRPVPRSSSSVISPLSPPTTQSKYRRMVLDEDNYKATPVKQTDYREPPMFLNPGVLDTGLKYYGNPYLVGVLPQLWLPVTTYSPDHYRHQHQHHHQQQQPRPSSSSFPFGLSHHPSMSPGNASDQDPFTQQIPTPVDIAQVVRLLEQSQQKTNELNQVCVHENSEQPGEASLSAERPSLSVFGRMFGTSLLSHKHHSSDGAQQQHGSHHGDESSSSSSDSDSDSSDDDDNEDDSNNISSAFHRIYYHHPERQQQQRQAHQARHHSFSANRLQASIMNRIHSTPTNLRQVNSAIPPRSETE